MTTSNFEPTTLVEILRRRVLHQPGRLAYTFLLDGETEEAYLTHADLDRRARAIGARLQSLGACGERALLLYPPGLDFIASFFGCLYAGVVAVPVYPPHPARLDRTLPRFLAIARDAQPVAVLTSSELLPVAESLFLQAPDLQALHWLATDTIAGNVADEWQPPALSSTSLALFQYTSGSTAAPRGVMLTHGNLLHNLELVRRAFQVGPDSMGVSWLPMYHDMGLTGFLEPLYINAPTFLMSPVAFLQRPLRWLQTISRTRGTTSGGPPFAYDLCIRKITPEQRATLDLSSWDVAFTGAEPVRYETLERFASTFAPCGFRHVVAATGEDAGARMLVGCGQSLRDQKIVIVHPETLTGCPSDEVGEIWIAGPSIAQGYWNQPEDTERTLHAYLADTGEGPFLRTGDLGFLKDGELFVTGRLKDLIIIDGYNHYPQDIELTVEHSYPALRPGCSAAFSVDVAGQERLVIAAEVERSYLPRRVQSLDTKEVVQAIRRAVAEYHELSVYAVSLLKPGAIPKTSSGKIQRHVCRTNFLAGSLDVIEK